MAVREFKQIRPTNFAPSIASIGSAGSLMNTGFEALKGAVGEHQKVQEDLAAKAKAESIQRNNEAIQASLGGFKSLADYRGAEQEGKFQPAALREQYGDRFDPAAVAGFKTAAEEKLKGAARDSAITAAAAIPGDPITKTKAFTDALTASGVRPQVTRELAGKFRANERELQKLTPEQKENAIKESARFDLQNQSEALESQYNIEKETANLAKFPVPDMSRVGAVFGVQSAEDMANVNVVKYIGDQAGTFRRGRSKELSSFRQDLAEKYGPEAANGMLALAWTNTSPEQKTLWSQGVDFDKIKADVLRQGQALAARGLQTKKIADLQNAEKARVLKFGAKQLDALSKYNKEQRAYNSGVRKTPAQSRFDKPDALAKAADAATPENTPDTFVKNILGKEKKAPASVGETEEESPTFEIPPERSPGFSERQATEQKLRDVVAQPEPEKEDKTSAGVSAKMKKRIEDELKDIPNTSLKERISKLLFTEETQGVPFKDVLSGKRKVVYKPGSVQIKKDTPAARNNNPGNLEFKNQKGATLSSDGRFAKFKTPEAGMKALVKQVDLDAGRGTTLTSFINKFAPEADKNDPKGYIKFITDTLGVSPNTKLSDINSQDLAAAMAQMESGTKITS